MTTTLLRNGHIHTPDHPAATALLVTDDRITWLGTGDTTDAGGADQVVELDGALVTPAFVDAHVHATSTGIALHGLDLSDTRSLDECLERVAAFTRKTRGRVILGHGWDETTWPEHRRRPARSSTGRPTAESSTSPASTCTRPSSPPRCSPRLPRRAPPWASRTAGT